MKCNDLVWFSEMTSFLNSVLNGQFSSYASEILNLYMYVPMAIF